MNSLTKSISAIALTLGILIPGAAFADNDKSAGGNNGVTIAVTNAGNVTVRTAAVTAVSGTTITASTTWGGTTLTWTVTTDTSTKFLGKGEGTISLADIAVGDAVSFSGPWNPGSALSVRALVVRDLTKNPNRADLVGTISAVSTSTASLSVAFHKRDRATTTVVTNSGTTIFVNGVSAAFASLAIGDIVKAVGLWNADQTVLTATTLAVVKRPAPEARGFMNFFKKWFSEKRSRGHDGNDD
ncbi:MAG: DUF5666 domain-containing protein [Patescibacteria group bacterium]